MLSWVHAAFSRLLEAGHGLPAGLPACLSAVVTAVAGFQ